MVTERQEMNGGGREEELREWPEPELNPGRCVEASACVVHKLPREQPGQPGATRGNQGQPTDSHS